MQRPDVQRHHGGDHEWQQIVQREEAGERRRVDGEAAPQQGRQGLADQGQGAEQAGDHLGPPEAHLAPGQHVAHERRHHHQEVDDAAQQPQHLAGRLVGAVVHSAQDVDVDGQEEHRSAVGVQAADQPAEVDVAHDAALHGDEGLIAAGDVVHGQDDAGDDLHHQAERQDAAEGVPVVEVPRRREFQQIGAEPDDRQARIEPALDRGSRLIGAWMLAHLRSTRSSLWCRSGRCIRAAPD